MKEITKKRLAEEEQRKNEEEAKKRAYWCYYGNVDVFSFEESILM